MGCLQGSSHKPPLSPAAPENMPGTLVLMLAGGVRQGPAHVEGPLLSTARLPGVPRRDEGRAAHHPGRAQPVSESGPCRPGLASPGSQQWGRVPHGHKGIGGVDSGSIVSVFIPTEHTPHSPIHMVCRSPTCPRSEHKSAGSAVSVWYRRWRTTLQEAPSRWPQPGNGSGSSRGGHAAGAGCVRSDPPSHNLRWAPWLQATPWEWALAGTALDAGHVAREAGTCVDDL